MVGSFKEIVLFWYEEEGRTIEDPDIISEDKHLLPH